MQGNEFICGLMEESNYCYRVVLSLEVKQLTYQHNQGFIQQGGGEKGGKFPPT